MAGFDDDEDNASGESGSEENEIDETMEDVDDADEADQDADMDGDDDGDGDGDGDGDDDEDGDDNEADEKNDEDPDGDNDDDEDGDEPESPSAQRLRAASRSRAAASPLVNGTSANQGEGDDSTSSQTVRAGSNRASLTPLPTAGANYPMPFRPLIRPETITASLYDIVPTIAAPQSTSINAITATPDMRWVFTGGSDGYIRKFNWVDTANSKLMLTVAQRHPFVDSVVKAGVLLSYWENEDSTATTPVKTYDDTVPVSPVYSLAVHNQALWLLSGDETGAITLQSVRHSEGTRIHTLREHKSAVSVLHLAPDERSVLSGSWDKNIHDWDLDTGQIKRTYVGSASQIASIEPRPLSSLPVPEEDGVVAAPSGTLSSNNAEKPKSNGALLNGLDPNDDPFQDNNNDLNGLQDAPGSPDDDMNSLFGDDDGGGLDSTNALGLGDDDDEFSRAIANGLQQQPEEDASGDTTMMDVSGEKPAEPTESGESQTAGGGTDSEVPPPADDASTDKTVQPGGAAETDDPKPSSTDAPSDEARAASDTIFLDASIDGRIRVWDRRQPNPIARINPSKTSPPWCMSACWSPDGNFIYAGRRNNAVDEYSLHKGLKEPRRTFKFPAGSGAVSAVRVMPNGKHLICASHDILRLYDLKHQENASRHSTVPFLIIPGHRTGVISQLFIDPSCSFLISTAGNRGWEGGSTEVMLGYEIGVVNQTQS